MESDGSLSAKQEQLMLAMLANPSIVEAAKTANVAERTAYRWAQLPAFKAAYRQARHAAFDDTLLLLMAGTSTALKVHLDMMKDPKSPPGLRLQAAKTWLEMAIAVHRNDEIERRLALLEEKES